MTQLAPFDPAAVGFTRLADFKIAGTLDTFEFANHGTIDGKADLLRLNIYFARDGDFVTIWCGLLEP